MLIQESFKRLFPEKELSFQTAINYSGRFKGFNARISKRSNELIVDLSKKWKNVNEEIKIGLIQELLLKILKQPRKKTLNIDLYNNFMKNAHLCAEKNKTHPILEDSFNRLNEKYFLNLIEKTNFQLSDGLRTLGHYHYGTDTIHITKHLLNEKELLDFVMFHEMLHKKHKFQCSGSRTTHHSTQFRKEERAYPNFEELEKKLNNFLRTQSIILHSAKNKKSVFNKSFIKKPFPLNFY